VISTQVTQYAFDQVFYRNVCTLSEQVFDMKYACASVLHVCLFCVTFGSSAEKRMASFITIEKDRSLPYTSANILMKLLKFMARTWVSTLTHDRVSCDALLKV